MRVDTKWKCCRLEDELLFGSRMILNHVLFECDQPRMFWNESPFGAICDKLHTLDFNGGLLSAYGNLLRGDFELLAVCLLVVWYVSYKNSVG